MKLLNQFKRFALNRFRRFAHIPISEFNQLFASVHAAHHRLTEIKVSGARTMYAVEKETVLGLLNDAKKITKRWS